MRKPFVNNKYKLTPADFKNLHVGDRSKLGEPLFHRNEVIHAWMVSGGYNQFKAMIGGIPYKNRTEFFIIFSDGKDTVRVSFSSKDGMCGYEFSEFFKEDEMDAEHDLLTQEECLYYLNLFLDRGIITLDGVKPKKPDVYVLIYGSHPEDEKQRVYTWMAKASSNYAVGDNLVVMTGRGPSSIVVSKVEIMPDNAFGKHKPVFGRLKGIFEK